MSEAQVDLGVQDFGNDVPSDESDDRLLTTRLPPITPPPLRPPSVPPSAMPTQPPFAPSGTYRTEVQPTNSWWRALLTATFPPPAMPSIAPPVNAEERERVLRRRIGATCAGMAIGFVILALALGLRGAEPAYSAAVSAALVLSRSLVALGFLAFGYALLRMAERVLTGRSEQ
jgi:hypothetical protein